MIPGTHCKITPDGSNRRFYRQMRRGEFAIVMEPGESPGGIAEAESYAQIGRHLHQKGVSVPEIYEFDSKTGIITMEDLGDIHLQTIALQGLRAGDVQTIQTLYEKTIDLMITMQFEGIKGFKSTWCFDTPTYDPDFAFQREALYFINEFACDYAGIDQKQQGELTGELYRLCMSLNNFSGPVCLLHRDFQSRNILWHKDAPWLIDFQGARQGPPFYDLASLLLDPYVQLPDALINNFLEFYTESVNTKTYRRLTYGEIHKAFKTYGTIRLIQAIAAYSLLWRKKGKTHFRRYLEPAIERLLRLIECEASAFAALKTVLQHGLDKVKTQSP